ncbi:MAG TPA: carboxymuconolactone decarboxylase family protein [Clostridiales bacterium UBA8153]|nr:carboxymuconolactone decarboxylase family protein [Clostridiales bacterium UBA8153]
MACGDRGRAGGKVALSRDLLGLLSRERPQVREDLGRLVTTLTGSLHLDAAQRELVRLAVAVAAGNAGALAGHLALARRAGLTRDQLVDAILLCIPGAGAPRALEALGVLAETEASIT